MGMGGRKCSIYPCCWRAGQSACQAGAGEELRGVQQVVYCQPDDVVAEPYVHPKWHILRCAGTLDTLFCRSLLPPRH